MRKIEPEQLTSELGYRICANLCESAAERSPCNGKSGKENSDGEEGANPFAGRETVNAKVSTAADDESKEPKPRPRPRIASGTLDRGRRCSRMRPCSSLHYFSRGRT